MKILSVALENFMSYRSRQVLPMADLGLVLINGENRVSNASDSNGAGKTAIFDALSWVLFGQTLRGLRADDVACRFNKDRCVVSVSLEEGGRVWEVERCRRPASLSLHDGSSDAKTVVSDESAATQERIERLLGFGFRTFKNALVFSQGAFERFATASQSDQLKMVDEIQNLDFSEPQERAKEWRDKAKARLDEIGRIVHAKDQVVTAAQAQIKSLELERDSFDQEKVLNVTRMEGEIKSAEGELAKAEGELDRVRAEREKVVAACQVADRLTEQTKEYNNLERELVRLGEAKRGYDRSRDQLVASVNSLAESGRCPKCRAPVSDVDEIRSRFQKDVDEAIQAADQAWASTAVIQNKRDALREGIDHDTQALLRAHGLATVDDFKRWRESYSSKVVDAAAESVAARGRSLAQLRGSLQREVARVWTGATSLDLARRSAREAASEIQGLLLEQMNVEKALRMAEYWVEAFGDRGIRSLMFDSVAHFLNERLAAHLEVLGAGEGAVTISALSALKKGGTREKLSVSAAWDAGAGAYAACSAGQTRRIDLALFGAIQDLAETRSARPFPLRIWDEAGDSLDARGKELFAEWVRREARQRGTGFVVTHDREFGEMLQPDHVWTVVMDEDGSRVEVAA